MPRAARPPRIGVTCSSAMGVTQPIAKVGRGYLDGVIAAGGLPVVLPTLDPALAEAALDGIDGLLLTGGGDIDPHRYGADVDPETGPPDPGRDAWDLALVAVARQSQVPILGICRGAQVLNVAYGGTLIQHLPARQADGHDDLERAALEVHDVVVALDSTLHLALGSSSVRANTLHHQSADLLGEGLSATGTAGDGVVEAIESDDEPVLGVQWHPELLLDRPAHLALFSWLVDGATR